MARLLVHVEGQTEEDFVNLILAPHLLDYGFTQVTARDSWATHASANRRGGIRSWNNTAMASSTISKKTRTAWQRQWLTIMRSLRAGKSLARPC